jgi:hypothetical protein
MTAQSMPGKRRSMALLVLAEVLVLSLWFLSSAIMPGVLAETAIAPARQALAVKRCADRFRGRCARRLPCLASPTGLTRGVCS